MKKQLDTELGHLQRIQKFYGNLRVLWLAGGTATLNENLSVFNTVQAKLPAPPSTAPAPDLLSPIVNFFLTAGSLIPEVGPVFGAADTLFNFASSLTTDQNGNQTISLGTTVGQLYQQAADQFISQGQTLGTQFALINQDWGKINALGTALQTAQDQSSPWYWADGYEATVVGKLKPLFEEAAYQNIMAALYGIGGYIPLCTGNFNWNDYYAGICNNSWTHTPIYMQTIAYWVAIDGSGPYGNLIQPFNQPWYVPYTFPTDTANPNNNPKSPTNTLLGEGNWLGISTLDTPPGGNAALLYTAPDPSTLAYLFTPKSQGGLGVYRPAFFERWPFPRTLCPQSETPTWEGGGCQWSSATVPPELGSVGAPRASVSIRAGMRKAPAAVRTITLIIINNGTTQTKATEISRISLQTLAGSGQASLMSPQLPIRIDSLKPGASATVKLQIVIPPGVTKLRMTEEGSIDSGLPERLRFSQGQVIYPQAGVITQQ